jgi:hypothetical protein
MEQEIKIPEITDEEILIVKVGSDEYPATLEDIRSVQLALNQAKADKDLTIVTHHLIDFIVVKRSLLDKVIIASNIDGLAKSLIKE